MLRTILELHSHHQDSGGPAITRFTSPTNQEAFSVFSMPTDEWVELGKPKEIRVTVEAHSA